MRRALILLAALLALPLAAQQASRYTLPISAGAAADPLTVLGPAAVCADQQIALWSGASATQLQCSVVTVADTTGTVTLPDAGQVKFSDVGLKRWQAGYLVATDGSTGLGGIAANAVGVISAVGDVAYEARFVANGFGAHAGFQYFWNSSATASGAAADIGLARSSAGVVKVTDGSTGYGDLQLDDLTVFGTTVPSATDYSGLSIAATDGAVVMGGVTAGTGADDVNVTVKGEGATATLTLDGSDDVAGSVTVSAAGAINIGSSDVGLSRTGAGLLRTTNGSTGDAVFTAYRFGTVLSTTPTVYAIAFDGSSGFDAAAPMHLKWSSHAEDSGAAKDTGLARSAAGVVKVTDGSTGIGKLLNARVVTPDIDGETTTAVQSGTVFTNTGDGDGEAVTLLNDPGIGVQYCFAVDVAQTITVAPSTGETLYYGTDNCVASLTSNAIGSTLCVTAITGGSGAKWFTMSHEGSWTCND